MSSTDPHVVVVGAGAAGHSAASALRQEGYNGRLTVVHGEQHPPYHRTLVNKAVMAGLLTPEQVALPALEPFDVNVVSARATGLDARAAQLVLDNGERLHYSALIAATGSTPRNVQWNGGRDGHLPERLLQMHTIDDAARVRDLLGDHPERAKVTLLGAGFIGAETASYLADVGVEVHLVSRPPLPLGSALGKAIAKRVARLHAQHAKTYFGHDAACVRAGADSVTVTLDDGTRLESDLAIVAHGTVPTARWLSGDVDGIPVDDRLRAPHLRDVYAAGSVAVHTSSTGHRYRIDHWDAATAQGSHAARTVLHDMQCGPDPGSYAPTTGFSLSVYRQPVAAFGLPHPHAQQRHHTTGNGAGILTTFHAPGTGAITAVAGLAAGRELTALRAELQRP